MSKVTMPDPVAWRSRYRSDPGMIGGYPWSYVEYSLKQDAGNHYEIESLITTDQAEAYAAAKVREALEEARSILTSMYTDAVKARVPEEQDEEGWNQGCLERALALTDAALLIRRLTPDDAAICPS